MLALVAETVGFRDDARAQRDVDPFTARSIKLAPACRD
jgi:hypothetical protein